MRTWSAGTERPFARLRRHAGCLRRRVPRPRCGGGCLDRPSPGPGRPSKYLRRYFACLRCRFGRFRRRLECRRRRENYRPRFLKYLAWRKRRRARRFPRNGGGEKSASVGARSTARDTFHADDGTASASRGVRSTGHRYFFRRCRYFRCRRTPSGRHRAPGLGRKPCGQRIHRRFRRGDGRSQSFVAELVVLDRHAVDAVDPDVA